MCCSGAQLHVYHKLREFDGFHHMMHLWVLLGVGFVHELAGVQHELRTFDTQACYYVDIFLCYQQRRTSL